jgi:hypothetical protein
MVWTLNKLDEAFPIIVRFVGLITTVVLVGFSLAGFYIQAAPGFVAAAGMILYKNVRDAAEIREEVTSKHEKDLSDW